jgi:anti-sigma factor RsiW
MSCSKFETDIALYAGGDLPPGRMARVEAHLAECADCRALAEDLRAEQALLSELRDDPLEDAMLAQVRQRVLAEVRHTGWKAGFSPRGALAPLLALAAALLLAVILIWPRHHSGAAPRAAAASHAVQAEVGRGPAAAHGAAPLARKSRHHLRRPPAAQPGPPLLVQFVTDDPNIVVYWLIDQKPQGD